MSLERVALWLKQHAASEKSFARVLRNYFAEQADRIAEASEKFQSLSIDDIPLIFRKHDEHEILLPVLRRNLGNLMAVGARAELQALESRSKEFDPGSEIVWEHLPDNVRQRILASLNELEEQDYWLELQSETEANLVDLIKDGISQGHNSYKISMAIREHLGGFVARKRAKKIARTETTGCMNAGHQAAMESLGSAVDGKQWLAIGDSRLRETHSAAHGQVARGAGGMFTVGGYEAPYPGHYSLPAQERANCRCTVISVLNEELLAVIENPNYDSEEPEIADS